MIRSSSDIGARLQLTTPGVVLALLAAALVVSGRARAAEAQPDLTGMWVLDQPKGFHLSIADLPLTPEARAQTEQQSKIFATGRGLPEGHVKCLPGGVPHIMTTPMAIEVLQTPGRVTLLPEISPLPRTVVLDVAAHPADLEASWNGHSIGHWEGEVLVVDTIGFNDRDAYLFNFVPPVKRTASLHLVERFTLVNAGQRLVDTMVLDDPKTFTRPFEISYAFRRLAKTDTPMEYVCEVNLVDLRDFEAAPK